MRNTPQSESGFETSRFPCRVIIALLAIAFLASSGAKASDLRQVINFNREWRFQLDDHPGAEGVAFDDLGWNMVGLPHSFSLPYFLSPKFYIGYGWYRKHFSVPSEWQGKRISLEFDGAFQVAELYVNGKRVGEHKGGYTGFTFEITEAVKRGDNLVAVRVNNLWDARLAPRAGEHTFSGGIYRDVRLVVTAPLHVGWYGTFVSTPQVSRESGTVNIKTEIVNESPEARSATVITRVLDPDGNQVAAMKSIGPVSGGAVVVFDQTSEAIARPKLWHPDHPCLYSARTSVLEDGKPADEFTSPFGFRWFQWTADRGFFLNGEHYYFKGVNVHQDHAGWGDAVADSGFHRDVKLVKDAGFDFIRGSHYPHDPAFSEACDRLGLLFWSENCFWGSGGFKGEGDFSSSTAYPLKPEDELEFRQSVRNSLRDMIRIHRNHPSIIAWSMSNEPFFTEDSTLPRVREFLRELVALSHELDPTRPAAIGGCQRGDVDKLGDIAGYNGDGAWLFMNPGIPNLVSEYGSTVADRPGKYEPGWGDLQQEQFPWRSGQALWCAFDHGSHAGRFGWMGMVDYFRLPKRQYYWYRNEYKHIPPPEWPGQGIPAGLRLTTDKTTLKSVDGTDDAQIIVTVVDRSGKALSNCPAVTLAVESGPGEFPTGPAITFNSESDIAIRDGQAAIEFRSYYSGKTLIRATAPGLKDASITITSLGEPKFVPGKTPPVMARPYVRFDGQVAPGRTSKEETAFGLENPTRASSEAPGHAARLANDGNASTFWRPKEGDSNAWWQVDLERLVTVAWTKLTFPAEGNYRYKIEISEDQNHWKLLADQTRSANTDAVRTDWAQNKATGRFLRITFAALPPSAPAALGEVLVSGQPGNAMKVSNHRRTE